MPKKFKKPRNPNFSEEERSILLDLVKQKFQIVECRRTDGYTKDDKDECWEEMTAVFNAQCLWHNRDAESLKLCWENMKKRTRIAFANERADNIRTGGGPAKKIKIDPLMEIVKELIKPSVTGGTNPYDSDKKLAKITSSTPVVIDNQVYKEHTSEKSSVNTKDDENAHEIPTPILLNTPILNSVHLSFSKMQKCDANSPEQNNNMSCTTVMDNNQVNTEDSENDQESTTLLHPSTSKVRSNTDRLCDGSSINDHTSEKVFSAGENQNDWGNPTPRLLRAPKSKVLTSKMRRRPVYEDIQKQLTMEKLETLRAQRKLAEETHAMNKEEHEIKMLLKREKLKNRILKNTLLEKEIEKINS